MTRTKKKCVRLERSGGILGAPRIIEIDQANLPDDLKALLDVAEAEKEKLGRPQGQARDEFQYKLVIERNESAVQLLMSPQTIPEKLQPLVDWLESALKR